MSSPFASIEDALADIRQGRMIVVCDDEGREIEGDIDPRSPVRDTRCHQPSWPRRVEGSSVLPSVRSAATNCVLT